MQAAVLWQNLHWISVTSLGRPTWWRKLFPGNLDTWRQPPSAATCVKATAGSQVAALRGGKLNSSPPSFPDVAAGMADVQPAAGISFSRRAANQASFPSTPQVTKSHPGIHATKCMVTASFMWKGASNLSPSMQSLLRICRPSWSSSGLFRYRSTRCG